MSEHGVPNSRLTVIQRINNDKNKGTKWLCRCSCKEHNEVIVEGAQLRNGNTLSCGCIHKEMLIKRNTIHGESCSHIYYIWNSMIKRCTKSDSKVYHLYGARGISVCDEWLDFQTFLKWAKENGYRDGLSLDRINNNGNYEPNNCRWATNEQQANNKRNNIRIQYNGETHTAAEWSKILGINYHTIMSRINLLGWSYQDALKPVNRRVK